MSSNLYWAPVIEHTNTLNDDLKFILRKMYGTPVDTIMDESDIDYLKGIEDAGVIEAGKLIKAINEYKRIRVTESY